MYFLKNNFTDALDLLNFVLDMELINRRKSEEMKQRHPIGNSYFFRKDLSIF